MFKYRKQTNFFLKKLNHQYEDYPVDGKYDFVRHPLHIEYCMKTLSAFFSNVIDGLYCPCIFSYWGVIKRKGHMWQKFEDISLLSIPRVFQIYEKMALVEAFIQILFYIVNNLERIFPKSPSFVETWITIKQYSLLKQKILLFLYELNHVRLPCICDLRRKSMITDLRHVYSQFIEREWENDKLYSDMFTDPSLTLEKIGCFDLKNYICEFLEKPSSQENMEIKSAILAVYTGVQRSVNEMMEENEYESLDEDELELFELYKWTTPECFVMAHNNALSKIFLRKK